MRASRSLHLVLVLSTLAALGLGAAAAPEHIASAPSAPQAATPGALDLAADLSGQMSRTVLSGSVAYVGSNVGALGRLTVYDVSSGVRRLSAVDLEGNVTSLIRVGSFIYAGIRLQGFPRIQAIDVNDPAAPALRGRFVNDTGGVFESLWLVGARLYAGGGESGLPTILSLADPANPARIGTLDRTGFSISVSGNRLVVGGSQSYLYDVSNPDAPVSLGPIKGGGQAVGLSGDVLVGVGNDSVFITRTSQAVSDEPLARYTTTGPITRVAISGERAYLLSGAGLLIVDISDPTDPFLVSTAATGGAVDVSIDGQRAAVVGPEGLQILDISAAGAPRYLAAWTLAGGVGGVAQRGDFGFVTAPRRDSLGRQIGASLLSLRHAGSGVTGRYDGLSAAGGLQIVGGLAYIADASTLRVVDVSDPANLRPVAGLALPGQTSSVTVVGGRAYLAGSGLQIVDVSNPASPRLIGRALHESFGLGVDVAGSLAYVAADSAGLYIFDIANPAAPVQRARVPTGFELSRAMDVAAVDGVAYVAAESSGLVMLDVANPAAPLRLGRYRALDRANAVDRDGSRLVIGDGIAGARILSVARPGQPALIGAIDGGVRGGLVDAQDGRVSVAGFNERNGLSSAFFADASALQPPATLAAADAIPIAHEVELVGDIAYVAAGEGGLQVWSFADPARPRRIGGLHIDGDTRGLALAGSYLYIVGGAGGITVADVSRPESPRMVGSAAAFFSSFDHIPMRVFGDRLYILFLTSVSVYDISSPTRPVELSAYTQLLTSGDVWVDGDRLLFAQYDLGLRVMRVQGTAAPVTLSALDTPGSLTAISARDTLVYGADGSRGLIVIDVADPAAPSVRGAAALSGFAQRLFVRDASAFVATSDRLWLVDVSDPAAPAPGASAASYLATDLTASGPLVFSALGASGLQVFWNRPGADTVIGAAGGALASAADGVTTTFPAGALPDGTRVRHTPRFLGSLPPTGALSGAGRAFELSAEPTVTAGPAPAAPFIISVTYSDAERGVLAEDTLALYTWDGAAWVRLAGGAVDPAANTVTAQAAQLGLFALLGQPRVTYLPLSLRQ